MEPGRKPLCEVVDCSIEYVTEEGFLPHQPGDVDSMADLVAHLHAAAARPPHLLHLNLPSGLRIVLAIGGALAAIRVVRITQDPKKTFASWQAKADRLYTTEIHGFFTTGYCPDVFPDHLMPADQVIQLALYLVEHEELPNTHVWLDQDGIPARL